MDVTSPVNLQERLSNVNYHRNEKGSFKPLLPDCPSRTTSIVEPRIADAMIQGWRVQTAALPVRIPAAISGYLSGGYDRHCADRGAELCPASTVELRDRGCPCNACSWNGSELR